MKKSKKLIKKIFVIILILFLFLIVLLSINYNFLGFFENLFKEPSLRVIQDNCGIVMGNLLHDIKSEDTCRIKCYNECILDDASLVNVEFIQNEGFCNECKCYCK